MEAFDLVNDATVYPEQLKFVDTWQPKRLYFNTGWWFYGSRENFDKADKSKMQTVDVGVYYPLKGMSNNEIASIASSQHLCQGFGRPTSRGSQQEYIEFLKGDLPQDNTDVFDGIDTSWNRIEGGKAIGDLLNDVEADFNFNNPAAHLVDLMKAYNLLQNVSDDHWKAIKTKELETIIQACAGLYLEISADSPTATQGNEVNLTIEALNRSDANIKLVSYKANIEASSTEKNILLQNNIKPDLKHLTVVPKQIKNSSPYWLNNKGTLGMYNVDEQMLIGTPENKRPVYITFNLEIEGQPISMTKDVIYRYSKPDKGELYRPFEIVPEASSRLSDKVYIFESDKQKEIEVWVKSGKDNLDGFVTLEHPDSWQVFPDKQKVSIANKGEEQKFVFTIIPPKDQNEGYITSVVNSNGKTYAKEQIEINYNHIPYQTVLMPSESKVVRLDIKRRGENIGYIEGAGDVVPESLQQIGYNVITIKPEDITPENLSRFDAVVVGIRAYNVVDELKFKQKHLFDFVKQGGNVIVQYNTSRRIKVDQLAPYDLSLSRGRVTDETAEVRLLVKDHPILNFPNTITSKDFDGWVQERGLYFPNSWSNEFTPILSLNDKGEQPLEGSLLVAKYGEGHYIYTGLSFFREFPAGVPGAYRLFANMLSIGKDNIKLEKKLTD